MSDTTEQLRAIAGQATPAPWTWDSMTPIHADNDVRVQVVQGMWDLATINEDPPPEIRDGSVQEREATARHIATFDPALVAAMLDVIEAAEEHERLCHYGGTGNQSMSALARTSLALARFEEVADGR